ncbi:tRNA (adenosine(37)-N6)-threonylcarbamoyltransferase complex dimerization subunit type 1 TsaB [Candidimonas nitroreducens]|uniref:[Ribosomal protein bS18]-alanine N-acetyltransferase n=1 Tax=Candidimonas nitroreducens TaxID=683354 RepID=A0A225M5S0_9BURK|nr:tRNA (adenosine(37)-N6)-threonylcarbamoyltransferase complex dimerization subunit type 1 TsaB [Candidimonas nitroreducens]OWT56694.1 bifunctional tRNA (adenosine(37)-N6)-threonylcarbamoyltransferase complex dimerization subunit type 1 TsaB/ribosomal-protein-alanine acetyltransferase RimI [Candidimonas nitroreducens]
MDSHILALETSSSRCGVALLCAGAAGERLYTAAHDTTGEHAERLLPMADELLRQAGIERTQLSAVGFGQGPGGFTGLRVACAVAQGVAYALGIPVLPIESPLALALQDAQSCSAPDDIEALRVIVQDARMGEVYLSAYRPLAADGRQWQPLQAPLLLNAGDVGLWLAGHAGAWEGAAAGGLLRVAGDGLLPELEAALPACLGAWDVVAGAVLRPSAAAVAQLALAAWRRGSGLVPEQAAPVYVRDKVAYTTLEREQGLGGNPRAHPLRAAAGLAAGAQAGFSQAGFFIRPMTAAHLDEVAQIESAVQSFPWTRGNFQDALQAGYGAWVAQAGGRVLGFCLVMYAPDVAHLLLIAVTPEAQRKGVGARLLRHCEREARARELPSLILEVRPSNRNALDFYLHRGFGRLSVRKGYYPAGRGEREDAWVLSKALLTEALNA